MAQEPLLECSFLIPIRRDWNLSDGGAHKRSSWDWLNNQLYKFGGGTRSNELYEGWYLDPDTGKRMTDRSKKFIVALPREKIEQLRDLLRETCGVFQQKCIYLCVAGYVEFIKGPEHETA